jgi:hypothetical protein
MFKMQFLLKLASDQAANDFTAFFYCVISLFLAQFIIKLILIQLYNKLSSIIGQTNVEC